MASADAWAAMPAAAAAWRAAQLASAAAAVLLVAIPFLRPLHPPLRRALQPRCAAIVRAQLPWVARAQGCTHPLLDLVVYASAFTVTPEFYLSFLPILVWCGYGLMVTRIVACLALSCFTALAWKDIIAAPRPADALQPQQPRGGQSASAAHSPRIPAAAAPLPRSRSGSADSDTSASGGSQTSLGGASSGQASAEQAAPARPAAPSGAAPFVVSREAPTDAAALPAEPGVPSLHCTLSILFGLFVVHEAWRGGVLADAHLPRAQLGACAWVAWVAWGRLYLGVHSPLDLAAGTALGLVMLCLWEGVVDGFGAWLLSGQPGVGSSILLASFLLMWRYPVPQSVTVSYNNNTCWTGAATGLCLAVARDGSGMAAGAPLAAWDAADPQCWARLAAKVAGGLLVVVGVKELTQAAGKAVLPSAFAALPPRLRLALQPPIALAAQAEAAAGNAKRHVGRPAGRGGSVMHTPKGLPWDVDVCARWAAYAAAVAVVCQWQSLWVGQAW